MFASRRSGWPSKLTTRAKRFLLREVEMNRRASTAQLAEMIGEHCGVVISFTTTKRVLHDHEMHGRRRKKKPLLCLAFAKDYVTKPTTLWKKILWSDDT